MREQAMPEQVAINGGVIRFAPVDPSKPYRCPVRHYEGDCGFDLFNIDEVEIPPKSYANIPHNIAVELPEGTWGMLVGRSSAFVNKGLMVVTGIIDNGYRGELSAMVYNTTESTVKVGMYERVVQLIGMPLMRPEARMVGGVKDLSKSDREGRGFGSTDKHQHVEPVVNVNPTNASTGSINTINFNNNTITTPNNESVTNSYLGLLNDRWTRYLPSRPKIVCLCGSTRFWQEFMKVNLQLTLAGYVVLSVGCNMKSDDEEFARWGEKEKQEAKENLDALHRHKIRMADLVVVINPADYIGESTEKEIRFAKEIGKEVGFLYKSEYQNKTKATGNLGVL